jgi:hypothetical protein
MDIMDMLPVERLLRLPARGYREEAPGTECYAYV